MCIIVDANVAAQVFAEPPHDDFVPVMRWLLVGNGRLVYGGHLARELERVNLAARTLAQLKRAGRTFRPDDQLVDTEAELVRQTGLCRSNDQHVVGLARVSGARTLCTYDKTLMEDFKNPKLLPRPRGSIYSRPEHTSLLKHMGCRWESVKRKRNSS